MKLCDLETAKALQELGYDGECNRWYNRDRKLKPTHLVDDDIPSPRLDDAAYWLRDKHEVWIEIKPKGSGEFGVWIFVGYLKPMFADFIILTEDFPTYDDALEAAVTKAIEIIKNKKQ